MASLRVQHSFQSRHAPKYHHCSATKDALKRQGEISEVPAATSIAGRYRSEKPDKLSTGTKQLRGKRRQMKTNGTPTDNIEYSEIYKAIRQKMKERIRKHDEKQIIEAIENSKSLKQARQKQRFEKGQLISIMDEEDGTHIHDKDRIVKRCVEFYEELYGSRRASADQDSHNDPTMVSTTDTPSLLPSKEASIKRLKHKKQRKRITSQMASFKMEEML